MAFATINSSTPKSIPAIEDAFAAEPSLKKRVYDAIGTTPQYIPLFEDIARYTSSLLARNTNPIISQPVQAATAAPDGPAAKKRKLEKGDAATGNAQTPGDLKADLPLQFYMPDVSFAIPQRKKLTLEFTAGRGFLRARNQTSKEVEFGVAWDKIQHVLCLPVPEKNQRQTNFCIIPQYGDGINLPPNGDPAPESIVWTVADGPPKAGAFTGNGQQIATAEGETAEQLVRKTLNENLSQTQVVRPDEREFVSAMPEAHRKGEKAYHVKAFRGSKEGYLFLLSTGILFGFKKPLLFFAFETIDSISYTSVLQRTFNLNVMARPLASEETQEFEFSMIDQADFSGIDAYIKKHGLQDASLAEARRAKRYNINGVKTEDGNTTTTTTGEGVDGEEEESELQKAQRELEDQEDEDEEDYDPGSDSDSDGSGSSSDDEDSEDGEGRADNEDDDDDDDDGDRDLVADELGSQAEDIPDDQL